MGTEREQARQRLTTTTQTGGIRVRMTPEGLAKLAARGDVAKLRRQIPMLEADQLAQLMAILAHAVREELKDVSPAGPRPKPVRARPVA